MERLTIKNWRNLDPWEMCGQDNYCKRGCHDQGGCTKGCIVPRIYGRLAVYEDTGLEPYEIKGFAEDVAYQFGYYFPIKDILYISTGGLSTLERAFWILGWNDPHPVPECECEVPGCHEHATCGTPTKDGYKRVCGKHFAVLYREEAEAALAKKGDSGQ